MTNPVLVRYLRVVTDADPAPLTQDAWVSLLDGLSVLDADDDDDWLEVAVGTARECAMVAGALRVAATPVTDPGALHATDHEPDPVDAGVAMLRACPPAVADVLAMGVVAGLGRDSIARITGLEPTSVLALVNEGQDALGLPLETLSASLRVPGSHAEVGDLATLRPLFAEQAHAGRPAAWGAAMAGAVTAGAAMAGAGVAAAAPVAAATAGVGTATPTNAATVVDLLTWNSPVPATSRVVLRASAATAAAATPSRWTTVGAGVAAWSVAIGGIGAAATMSGFLPSVIDGLFGDHGRTPVVVAQGPRQPGEGPSTGDGGVVAQPRPSGQQPGTKGTVVPVGTSGSSGSGGGAVVSAVSTSFDSGTKVVVVPAVVTSKPPTTPSTPSGPVTTPPTTQKPPTSGGGTVTGAAHGHGKNKDKHQGHAYGKGHSKHSTGAAKGRHQAAKPSVKAKATKAAAAVAKAAKAAAKGKATKPATAKAGKARSKA